MNNETAPARERDRPGKPRYRWLQASFLLVVAVGAYVALFVYGPLRDRETISDIAARTPPQAETRRVSILAAPIFDPEVIPGELAPVARYLERALLVDIDLQRGESYRGTLEELLADRADVALLPALACVQARETNRGVRFLAIQSFQDSFTTTSLLVVRRADPVSELGALRGRPICYVDQASATGYALARAWLRSQGLFPDRHFSEKIWSGSQTQALRDLAEQRCDVAAVSAAALHAERLRQGKTPGGADADQVRVLARTGTSPLPCWAASPALDENLARALAKALTSFDVRADAKRAQVGPVLRIVRFRPADSSTYRGVRVAAQLQGLLPRRNTR